MRPYVRAANVGWSGWKLDDVKAMNFTDAEMDIYRLAPGDLLLGEASGSAAEVGKPALWEGEIDDCAFQNTLIRVRPTSVHPRYLLHYFSYCASTGAFARSSRGVGIYHLGRRALAEWPVPMPSVEEQHRIAAVLDAATVLRARRLEAIDKTETLARAVFLETFGDPISNPLGHPTRELGQLAMRFSDGPFGSHLKSAHYVGEGVRVIRLQNIGVGTFLEDDRAFVSLEHFESLKKHECLPGDILIGTLGDPNLRACIQPRALEVALNKADCVQMRVDPDVARPEWACALLNLPETEALAQRLVKGQTRARISMGRLRHLQVPVPPLDAQARFEERVGRIRLMTSRHIKASAFLDDLLASLQHQSFRGDL